MHRSKKPKTESAVRIERLLTAIFLLSALGIAYESLILWNRGLTHAASMPLVLSILILPFAIYLLAKPSSRGSPSKRLSEEFQSVIWICFYGIAVIVFGLLPGGVLATVVHVYSHGSMSLIKSVVLGLVLWGFFHVLIMVTGLSVPESILWRN